MQRKSILLRLDPDLHKQLKLLATVRGEGINSLIVMILANYMRKHPVKIQNGNGLDDDRKAS